MDEEGSGGIDRARALVEDADRVVVLTGAGISAESGVPTFRGEDGLWRNHRPEELATPEAFARDPRLVWEWYGWRRERIAPCRPNAAHRAVARRALGRGGVRVVTQNVDGLHALAAREVAGDRDPGPALPLELHGSIVRVRCTECGERYEHRDPIEADTASSLPRCRACGSLLRPDVVWFGEPLDPEVITAAFEAAAAAAVCVVIGTSAVVHPAASIPLETEANGGAIVEINPDRTPLTSRADVSIRARAGAAVPPVLEQQTRTGRGR